MSTHAHASQPPDRSLNALAFSATVHCLTGCAIGEVLGMVIGTALGFSDLGDDRAGGRAGLLLRLLADEPAAAALGDDRSPPSSRSRSRRTRSRSRSWRSSTTRSCSRSPARWRRRSSDVGFWAALAAALLIAGAAAYPANRWLLARGKGHAVVHAHHGTEAAGSPCALTRRVECELSANCVFDGCELAGVAASRPGPASAVGGSAACGTSRSPRGPRISRRMRDVLRGPPPRSPATRPALAETPPTTLPDSLNDAVEDAGPATTPALSSTATPRRPPCARARAWPSARPARRRPRRGTRRCRSPASRRPPRACRRRRPGRPPPHPRGPCR